MAYLFTSESVSEGHPDKISDQISDALVDNFLVWDANSKVACETLVTTGQVVIAGEVKSTVYLDVQKLTRKVIEKIGYNKSSYRFEAETCGVLSAIHEQSADINRGVDRGNPEDQGAGDQGIMFGYATDETENFMPLALDISHLLLKTMADIRKGESIMSYLGPDAKAQVTIEYDDDNTPIRIDTIVISTQHDEFVEASSSSTEDVDQAEKEMLAKIKSDILEHVLPRVRAQYPHLDHLFDGEINYLINPTGKFVIGGPHGDAGLTGRKIIVDTYGGKGAHGGGAFSGKDPSKVDRSAAYAMRHLAKNIVASGICSEVLVQISYAIGVAEPCGLFINTYGSSKIDLTDGEIAKLISDNFDFRPYALEKSLKLRQPMYSETAAYGHFGRPNEVIIKRFSRMENGQEIVKEVEVELFTWEKLDLVDQLKSLFKI